MKTMDLKEASAFLHMHPVTLLRKVNAGEIPGAKVGKRWLFVDVDLIDHLRSNYSRRALRGDTEVTSLCLSSNAKTRPSGGSKSPIEDDEYSKVLALPTGRRLGST